MRWAAVVTRLGEMEKLPPESLQGKTGIDGMMILKWNLKEQPVDSHHMAPDTVWLWAVINMTTSVRFPRMTEIFFTGLLASEEGLCSMELFTSI
jgi:hypothetical protein